MTYNTRLRLNNEWMTKWVWLNTDRTCCGSASLGSYFLSRVSSSLLDTCGGLVVVCMTSFTSMLGVTSYVRLLNCYTALRLETATRQIFLDIIYIYIDCNSTCVRYFYRHFNFSVNWSPPFPPLLPPPAGDEELDQAAAACVKPLNHETTVATSSGSGGQNKKSSARPLTFWPETFSAALGGGRWLRLRVTACRRMEQRGGGEAGEPTRVKMWQGIGHRAPEEPDRWGSKVTGNFLRPVFHPVSSEQLQSSRPFSDVLLQCWWTRCVCRIYTQVIISQWNHFLMINIFRSKESA